MTPDQERKLDSVGALVGRIDERTAKMDEYHQREIRAAHQRITEVRAEARQDVDDLRGEAKQNVDNLRGEVRRISGLISTIISAVVAGGAKLLGLGGS